ncbi:MAG: hypothetical protein JWM05_2205, partial [Acidimicrobiales bacterium]|nr:hypothetical protein [Acidimicrobiales bacterium]
APALIELPDRSVVAAWAAHSRERVVHVARRDPATPAWRSIPAIVATREPARAAYANLVRLAAENGGSGRLYDLFRGDGASPSALVSDDGGRTWRRAGTVLTNPSHRGASTRPYLRYASRGVDRIDFVASSGNPHEEDGSSVSVGFIQAGRVHAGSGTDLGPLDGSVRWSRLTPLRRGVAGDNATHTDTDVWTADLEEGPGGPVAALTTRLPSAPAAGAGRYDHRYQYARRTGGRWVVNELALGGGELYRAEPDYAGGVAIDPGDVDRVVISTNVNPRTGAALRSRADGRVHWELYEGVTRDQGATWTWGAVTTESSADNLRPTIVTGADGRRALLWMRGRYRSYTSYATAIVGIVRAR